ncbi:MAG: ECF transporter S component [Prevotellaceae bacterium]|jgi:hypothetical protein|nr:ECF transporter S component [Prevotellaceae bacterium]
MNASAVKLYSLSLSNAKTYLYAALFVAGNILFSQLCHIIPNGGFILAPIYFFTLVGSYKYGMKTGLLIAVLTPIICYILVGMPPLAKMPIILIKSGLLAVAASIAAQKSGKISLLAILLAILAYQLIGTGAEWFITSDISIATQDFWMGYPGLLFQLFGGYAVLKLLAKV